MEIKVKLVHGAFMFVDQFALKREDGVVSLDLSGKDDAFIKTIAMSIGCGKVVSDTDHEEVLKLISDRDARYQAATQMGVKTHVPEVTIVDEIEDVIEAPVEILEIVEKEEEPVEETKAEEETEDKPEEEELPKDLELPDMNLNSLLRGNNKTVANKIKSAGLNPEQKDELLALEEAGRNRATIKSVIKDS